MTRRTTTTFRERLSNGVLEMANIVRRVVFGDTAGGQWGTEGYETGDGIEGDGAEPTDVYQGLYMYARPAADDNAEGIMLSIGASSNNPAVAALRNEDARRRYVEEFGDLEPGEVAIFNSGAHSRFHISTTGLILIEAGLTPTGFPSEFIQQVLIRSRDGATEPLVKVSEHDGHTHGPGTSVTPSGGGPVTGISGGAAAVNGTEVLEAE